MRFFPYPCLVADVGGTNARFASVESRVSPLSPAIRLQTGLHEEFAETVEVAIAAGGFARPRSLLLAAAGIIEGQSVTLTNARTLKGLLCLDGPHLAKRLGLEQGLLLNDFEALSLSLPYLPADGLQSLGGGQAITDAPRIVIGPGTGLGVGALVPQGERFFALASEGGHVGIGPVTPADFALWPFLGKNQSGGDRLSGDDILSGRGLTRLYRGFGQLAAASGSTVPDHRLDDNPEAISARAMARTDPLAIRSVDCFLSLLGRLAGDMALVFGARGGVYIGGGIAPGFATDLITAAFREPFIAKDSHRDYLSAIPVSLIIAPYAALVGLAELARNPDRFILDFSSRCWL